VDTGPFVVRLHTAIQPLAREVQFLYADFPVAPEDELTDFHVYMRRPVGLRRWLRPQVRFALDGVVPFEPLPLRLAIPMLEWSLNWCAGAHAHQYLMIHAAVVEWQGRALLLPGKTGSGKSTLCGGLVARGWRLLSDEFAMVRPRDARLAPWPRPLSLKGAAIDLIAPRLPGCPVGRRVPETGKGTIAYFRPPADSVRRSREPATPAWVVFPTWTPGEATRLAPVRRARAFFRLADNSMNYERLGTRGFETLERLVERVLAWELTYGDLDESLALLEGLAGGQSPRT
jgi:hypothetical protein